MTIISFLRAYWKPLAIVGMITLVFLFGYYNGYEHEKTIYNTHLANDARLTAIAKVENDLKIKQANQVSENITKEYANAVNKITTYYNSHPRIISLCHAGSTASPMPTTSQSTNGVNATVNGTSETATEIDLQKASQEITQCQALIKFEQEQESIQ